IQQQVVEYPEEHEVEVDVDNIMKTEVAYGSGVHSTAFRYKHKKRSKVWEEYKPIFLNGKVQFAECLYCHNRLSCKDSNGTSHLWRHQKICPAKSEAVVEGQQKDSYFSYVLVNGDGPVSPIDPANQIISETLDDIGSATPSRFKSKVWKEFTPIYVEGKLQAADCIHCQKRLSANKFGGRSHLSRHLLTCPGRLESLHNQHKFLFEPSSAPFNSRVNDELSPALTNGKVQIAEYANKLPRTSTSDDTIHTVQPIQMVPAHPPPTSDGASLKKQRTSYTNISTDKNAGKFCQETSYQELAKMIILHAYPFSVVEHEEMRRVIKNLNPMVGMVSHNDMKDHCTALFQKEKINIKDVLTLSSRRVSLSASIWTPDGPEPTEASVPESESGSYNVMWDAIRDWNLDQKILSLTSVGDVRNNANTVKLKEMLIEKKCLPIRGKLYNIPCLDDILNSVVAAGQADILRFVGDAVMGFFVAHASSPSAQQQLLEVISQMSLKCPQEDAKWWHKFYFRLEVLLHFKKSFPSEEVLNLEDMNVAESICKILRTFYRVIEVISCPSSVTANIYFNEVWKVRTVLQEEASNGNGEFSGMVMEMQEAFHGYWQNSYLWLSIPVVLDPRFKIGFIEFRLKRAFGTNSESYLSDIRETVRELFNEYCNPTDLPSTASNSAALDADNDLLEDWDQHLNEQASCQISTELDDYLEEGLVPRKDEFDILNWWMNHTTKYPTLAAMAQDILAMPASAVQSEAAFSSSGPVIPKHYSTLNIKTIEALVCARDWMR
uniref:BED-type domain-containing protein n=1 Tax=Aegilops tauschii subsp. strangulata TaxID=200361 RepID=A0A453D198_AEGTS